MRILVVASFPDSLLNFRGSLLSAMVSRGCDVHVAAPYLPEGCALRVQLEDRGLKAHDIPLSRTGTNPTGDLYTLWALRSLMQQTQPDVLLAYTIKPVIYGMLAAWLAGVPNRFALITGLGYAFSDQAKGLRGFVKTLAQGLYRLALRHASKVIFQNPDDELLFRQLGLVASNTPSLVVNGSGIDLARFKVVPLPVGGPYFLLIARLLGDKGVREYAQAAQRIKFDHPQVRFYLAGWIDETPGAIPQTELDAWVRAGTLNFLGRLSDVRPAIAACSVYVLPSYREGTPRTVLEAMSIGRAVITTDAPGCRETVVDGDNGFLVPVRSVDALSEAMDRFITDPTLAARMGQRSRMLAEDKYDVHKVNALMLKEMNLG